MTSAYIISACRSPVTSRGGALAQLSLPDLAAPILTAALTRGGIAPRQVDEVICSTALGPGGNPARSIALAAGLPEHVAGLSIDRQCAGGLDALALARQMILSGAADIVVAGGAESYSRQPLRYRTFADSRPPEAYTQAPFTPWPERDPDMTDAAAALGRSQGISRQAQDEWAVESHAKARAHLPSETELVPLAGSGSDTFTRRLSPALCRRAKVLSGDITAANAAVAADAAAFCVVVSDRVAVDLTVPKSRTHRHRDEGQQTRGAGFGTPGGDCRSLSPNRIDRQRPDPCRDHGSLRRAGHRLRQRRGYRAANRQHGWGRLGPWASDWRFGRDQCGAALA